MSSVAHLGKQKHSGHYVAFGRHFNNAVYEFSDDKVWKINPELLAWSQPYLVFYQKECEGNMTNNYP